MSRYSVEEKKREEMGKGRYRDERRRRTARTISAPARSIGNVLVAYFAQHILSPPIRQNLLSLTPMQLLQNGSE